MSYFPNIADVKKALERTKGVVEKTPFQHNLNVSNEHNAHVYLKREDLQQVRSYKIRGAYNKIASLDDAQLHRGVVCASAGNHAQGVAYSCRKLGIQGVIFMPTPTPKQKVEQVRMFGGDHIRIMLTGDTFDDAQREALSYCAQHDITFIPPFDDEKVIEGQATIALEILEQADRPLDYLFLPVGGGGLAAGVSAVFHHYSPATRIIGVEPAGAPSMSTSLQAGVNIKLDKIDKFVDGAAVQRVGERNFEICRQTLHDVVTVAEGKVCETILKLYNKDAIVIEPAGALSLAALDLYQHQIAGKTVACIVSGSNNDISRTEEIKERALLYAGLKHYFIVTFPQRAGALKEFVAEVLGEHDDITHFEYTKKTSREKGSAVVGIELKQHQDFDPLLQRMKDRHFFGQYLNDKQELLSLLV